MSIRSSLGTGPVAINTTATVIFQPSGIDRYAVSAFSVFNNSGSDAVVDIYISDTTTGGDWVCRYLIRDKEEADMNAIIGQGYANKNILAIAAATGMVGSLTRTEYTDGD